MENTVDIRPLCDRVVVDRDGTAVRPESAFDDFGVVARVIFVRGDGMAFGAPPELETVAYRLWPGNWKEYGRWSDADRCYVTLPISAYKGPPKRRARQR